MYWGISDYFQINTDIRRGCMTLPFLFILTLDFVMWCVTEPANYGLFGRDGRQIVDLVSDDDFTLLTATQWSLNKFSGALECKAVKIRLEISASKSKILCVGNARIHTPILVGQQLLEEVNCFMYFGSIIDSDSSSDKDVSCQTGKASATMRWLMPIWRSVTIAL